MNDKFERWWIDEISGDSAPSRNCKYPCSKAWAESRRQALADHEAELLRVAEVVREDLANHIPHQKEWPISMPPEFPWHAEGTDRRCLRCHFDAINLPALVAKAKEGR